MVIRRSAATEIRTLVERLAGGDPADREAASARLAILGPRAVGMLTRALREVTNVAAQAAILRTLEAIQDPRSLAPAAALVDATDVEVATAAVAVLRGFLQSTDAALAEAAFERLAAVTLDPTRPEAVCASALEALSDLPPSTTAGILRELQHEPSARLRPLGSSPHESAARPATLAEAAAAARCPEPADLKALVVAEGATVPLSVLGRLIERLRARETAETATSRRAEWQAARGAVHQALASRRSRLALHDLRESLAVAPGPLPVGFVAALEAIGDGSCLDEIAAAYLRARRARDAWWTEHLASTFRAIVRRERLTRRSRAVRHVSAKWPQAAEELLPARRR